MLYDLEGIMITRRVTQASAEKSPMLSHCSDDRFPREGFARALAANVEHVGMKACEVKGSVNTNRGYIAHQHGKTVGTSNSRIYSDAP